MDGEVFLADPPVACPPVVPVGFEYVLVVERLEDLAGEQTGAFVLALIVAVAR